MFDYLHILLPGVPCVPCGGFFSPQGTQGSTQGTPGLFVRKKI